MLIYLEAPVSTNEPRPIMLSWRLTLWNREAHQYFSKVLLVAIVIRCTSHLVFSCLNTLKNTFVTLTEIERGGGSIRISNPRPIFWLKVDQGYVWRNHWRETSSFTNTRFGSKPLRGTQEFHAIEPSRKIQNIFHWLYVEMIIFCIHWVKENTLLKLKKKKRLHLCLCPEPKRQKIEWPPWTHILI